MCLTSLAGSGCSNWTLYPVALARSRQPASHQTPANPVESPCKPIGAFFSNRVQLRPQPVGWKLFAAIVGAQVKVVGQPAEIVAVGLPYPGQASGCRGSCRSAQSTPDRPSASPGGRPDGGGSTAVGPPPLPSGAVRDPGPIHHRSGGVAPLALFVTVMFGAGAPTSSQDNVAWQHGLRQTRANADALVRSAGCNESAGTADIRNGQTRGKFVGVVGLPGQALPEQVKLCSIQ